MKIQKGIEIPLSAKYPFPDMEVGDSFFIPANIAQTARMAAHQHGVRYGKKFCTRSVKEGKHKGVRVWRIE
jgi:hypothetical protein